MRKIIILFLLLGFVSCKKVRTVVSLNCPNIPKMLGVKVVNGSISGDALGRAIANHKELWKYIHEMQKLGCIKR